MRNVWLLFEKSDFAFLTAVNLPELVLHCNDLWCIDAQRATTYPIDIYSIQSHMKAFIMRVSQVQVPPLLP